jgi:hypothetical protein
LTGKKQKFPEKFIMFNRFDRKKKIITDAADNEVQLSVLPNVVGPDFLKIDPKQVGRSVATLIVSNKTVSIHYSVIYPSMFKITSSRDLSILPSTTTG